MTTRASEPSGFPISLDDTKPTNPKDAIGSTKLPIGSLVPSTIGAHVALAYLEGALKYGRYNWRIAGVRASIYKDALDRHVGKWWNGQDRDPKTRVHHLASAIACLGIILDAELCGLLTDDRPPRAPLDSLIDEADETVRHLMTLFAGHTPKQFTIADGPEPAAPFTYNEQKQPAEPTIVRAVVDAGPRGSLGEEAPMPRRPDQYP